MAFDDYDIGEAFSRIEEELIDSMMRNLSRHLAEEQKEGFDWSQWQVEQLKHLNEYRRKNQKKYGPQFDRINKKMVEMIREAEKRGQKDEELRILRGIADDKKMRRRYANKKPSVEAKGDAFFRTSDRKLNALIDATRNDMQRAERAVLRRTNDQYRQIIYNAQVYANTGAGTPQKAIDMATKDFISRGIDSIVYRNGSRHTISDYADMYIRTAERRATLVGEGRKRQEWGEHLVIVNKRGGTPCPHCIQWVGKILIDDVYSGGKPDGKHKLLSQAMDEGFLHPRCKDGFTTYIPGITKTPDPVTKEEKKAAVKVEEKENRENYVERQADRQDRLAEHSLDPDNRMTARHRANQWKEQAAPFKPAETIEEAQEYAMKFCNKNFMDRTFKGEVNFKEISLEHANAINRSLTDVYDRFSDLEKLSGIKVVAPGSAQGKKAFKSGADALFSYSPVEHGIFINKDILKNPKALDEYMQRSKDAWDLVMNNMDKLSGKQRELAERYQKAGRDLVSGDTVEGLFTHELGHHVQWTMFDPKTTNSITSRMQQYAPHLSGYATASNSEYLAESFAAYMKGETDLLDPEYVDFLTPRTKAGEAILHNIEMEPEPIKGFHAVHENLVVDTMRKEYDPWIESLSKDEKHAVRKYTRNSLEEEKNNKFYQRLNAMLRGDAPEDPYLRGYANTISAALKKQPLQEDIICFRNLDVDPFEGIENGKSKIINQFFSTSVIKTRAMKGDYQITILVPKGTPGAYIEKLSRVPNQREFLIDMDIEYRVKSRRGKNIIVEVVSKWKR